MYKYFLSEYKKLIALAIPLIVIQLCQASLGLIDTLLAGRYHYQDLAAVGLGSAIWTSIYIFLVGILYVLVPKFASLAGEHGLAKRQQLYQIAQKLVIQLSVLGVIVVNIAAYFVEYLIADKEVRHITQLYMQYVSLSFPALVSLSMLRFVCEGHKRLRVLMLVFAALLALNFVFSYWMVYGGFGVPSMGGVGCGIGTVISAYLGLFLLFKLTQKELPEIIGDKGVRQKSAYADAFLLLKEGLPIGTALVLQIFALALIAFTAASLGTKYVAAHQIMINIAMCIVMTPLALANASTIQISGHLAQKDSPGIKTIITGSMLTVSLYGLVVLIAMVLANQKIVSLFTLDDEVRQIANSVLIYFIGFLILDSSQMMLAGILRGFQDFIRPLMATLVAYWIFTLPILLVLHQGWLYKLNTLATIWLIMMLGLLVSLLFLLKSTFSLVKNISINS